MDKHEREGQCTSLLFIQVRDNTRHMVPLNINHPIKQQDESKVILKYQQTILSFPLNS